MNSTIADLVVEITASAERMRLNDPMEAYLRRYDVPGTLVGVARNRGYDAHLVSFAGWLGDDLALPECSPWLLVAPEKRTHLVAEVEGFLIDWTARQFDPAAAFPSV